MGNGFAGAQDAGDRRRRRLSQDDHDPQLFGEFFPDDLSHDSVGVAFAEAFPNSARLLRRFVSPRLWKHVCVLTVVFVAVVAIVCWDRSSLAGPAANDYHASLITGITGLLLLFAGQLAFAIGWIRSQSTLDFRGRYRWWKWLAVSSVGAGLAMLTGTHRLIPDAIASLVEPITGPIQAARPALVLVVGLLCCVVVFGRVIPDMSRSVWSQGMLVTALLVMTVRLMLIHTSSRAVVDQATLSQMLLCSASLSFSAMLLHCRFVAFVNNDPPASAQQHSKQPVDAESAEVAPLPVVEDSDVAPSLEVCTDDNTEQPVRKKRASKKKSSRGGGRKAA